jgi:hypothetical protein
MCYRSSHRLLALAGIAALVLLDLPTSFAQSYPFPRFESASVKLQPYTGQGSVGIMVRGNTLDAEHVSVFSLVTFAL